jgi:phosphatidylserine decarboxylase
MYIDIYTLTLLPFVLYIITKNKIVCIFSFIFILYFSRTPNKKLSKVDPTIFYSPSSGYVKNIFTDKDNMNISLFLNIFDNHTQYIPIKSTIVSSIKKNGTFLPAYKEHSINNEQIIHTLYNKEYDFYYKVTQITGILTRRIVIFAKKDTLLEPGDQLGIILLGSRVDISIPLSKVENVFVKKDTHIDAMTEMFNLKTTVLS